MANRAVILKQADLTRYLKAAAAAGVVVARVEVDGDGTVRLFTPDGVTGHDGPNPCDRLLK